MSPIHLGATVAARIVIFTSGLLVLGWTLHKLRRRVLLVPIGSLFLLTSTILISFAASPHIFDTLAYALGIDYPPALYLVGVSILLMLLIIQLAARISVLDVRCRRLMQELAIRDAQKVHS